DDNATNRTILEHQVRGWGVHADVASNGKAGLAMLRVAEAEGRPYELALVDMHMPGMDGLDFALAVRAEPEFAGIRLVLLTSRRAAGEGAEARRVGSAACLTKPVRRADLYRCLAGDASEWGLEDGAGIRMQAPEPDATLLGRQVLLAEDNPVNQEFARTIL